MKLCSSLWRRCKYLHHHQLKHVRSATSPQISWTYQRQEFCWTFVIKLQILKHPMEVYEINYSFSFPTCRLQQPVQWPDTSKFDDVVALQRYFLKRTDKEREKPEPGCRGPVGWVSHTGLSIWRTGFTSRLWPRLLFLLGDSLRLNVVILTQNPSWARPTPASLNKLLYSMSLEKVCWTWTADGFV